MRFLLSLTLPLFLFLTPSCSLDSETNSPAYKFVTVSGEPTTLNASDVIQVASFEECTGKCEKDPVCVMAYQANSSDPCYLFAWNSIQEVTRNESGGVGTVAFKVFTDQPSCELNSPFLLNGKVYPINPNDTTNYLWKIDTSEGGWKITYIDNRIVDSFTCANFTFNRPYEDGCNPECNITMVQVWAKPGPITIMYGKNDTVETWTDCLNMCYNEWPCNSVHYDVSTKFCFRFKVGMVTFIERMTASDGNHMAIKLPMNDKNCKMTTDQLLDNQYYLVAPAMYYPQKRMYFRVQTTPKYYLIKTYLDKDSTYQGTTLQGCPYMSMASGYWNELSKEVFCYRHSKQPGITQTEAKELCHLQDMELLTDKYTGAVSSGQKGEWYIMEMSILQTDLTTPVRTGFGFPGMNPVKSWYGLEKVGDKWTWSMPEFRVFKDEDMPIPWAVGTGGSGDTCAYLHWGTGADEYAGYDFIAAPCNSTDVDGFSCGSWQQEYMDIKQYKDVTAEFGYEQDCCGFSDAEWKELKASPY
ncbi:hypothetical protein CAEBREN_05223 [Caenorhabditis brenneri]|uniref:PAN-3 domain-containing protein n=1 Tax=Caenorhabditis brenneri TaxID=135651 RepID=G0PKN4_CAEBE|nr:hypothetical protein CAEBREN_05223 [Caenorhabditis brenneri]